MTDNSSAPGCFTKKPVTIEAIQWTGDNREAVQTFLTTTAHAANGWVKGEYVEIGTLEGLMVANLGDWIIRGVKGEHYPCKPDIFEATYQPADLCAADRGVTVEPLVWEQIAPALAFPKDWRELNGGMNLKQQEIWANGFQTCREQVSQMIPYDVLPATPSMDNMALETVASSLDSWANAVRDGRNIDPSVSGLRDMAKAIRTVIGEKHAC